jgi:ABC-type polysaccharide/polyol phosphate export permease
MILAAGYLLWMYQRVVFGEPSAFLKGLGDHLTDISPTEILTLAPLGALVVVFGFFPGILLALIAQPVAATLAGAAAAPAIAVDPLWVAVGLGLIVAVVAARFASLRPSAGTPDTPGTSATLTEGAS